MPLEGGPCRRHPDPVDAATCRRTRPSTYHPDVPDERVSAILKTADVARTIEWYRQAGFELGGVHPETGDPTWCELSRDGVVLQFLGGETPWPDPPGFTGTLYFYPRSVEALAKEIEGRIEPAWGPEVREWGSRELGLRDPNGYFLTFTEDA